MIKTIKKHPLILILTLVIVMILAGVSFSLTTKTVKTPHEMLNTGVVFIWADGNGVWQKGHSPNSTLTRSFSVNIGKDRTDVKVSTYNGSNFSFGKDDTTSHWNKTAKCSGKSSFNTNYIPYSVSSGTQNFKYDKDTGNITVTQTVTLSSSKLFDVAYYVKERKQQEVYNYLGDNIPSSITEPMNKMLKDPKVQGYLYFCPVVINYTEVKTQVIEEPLELTAELELPSKGETNTPYPVKDVTVIPKGGTFQSSKLEKSVDGGKTYTLVNDWDSNKQNAEMQDKNSLAIEIKYRLTVYLTTGESSTDEKSIVLEDKTPELLVSCEAHLHIKGDGINDDGIPYTYVGHKVLLIDKSIFYVTDENGKTTTYSAEEAYNMGIAKNNFAFDTPRSDWSLKSYSDIKKEVVWNSTGIKYITLTVTMKDGKVIAKREKIAQ